MVMALPYPGRTSSNAGGSDDSFLEYRRALVVLLGAQSQQLHRLAELNMLLSLAALKRQSTGSP